MLDWVVILTELCKERGRQTSTEKDHSWCCQPSQRGRLKTRQEKTYESKKVTHIVAIIIKCDGKMKITESE